MRIIVSFDEAGAEWVVVAYLAADERMIEVCESGKSPHVVTGALMTGLSEELVIKENDLIGHTTDPNEIIELRARLPELSKAKFLPRDMSIRQCGKKSNHGLNYDEEPNMFSLLNAISIDESTKIVYLYKNEVYPGVTLYHNLIRSLLKKNRRLVNCFGRVMVFKGVLDKRAFKAGYAALPQSTVVDLVNEGMIKAYNDNSIPFMKARLKIQEHDALYYSYSYNNKKDVEDLYTFITTMKTNYLNPLLEYNNRSFRIRAEAYIGLNIGEKGEHNSTGLRKIKCESVTQLEEDLKHLLDDREKTQ